MAATTAPNDTYKPFLKEQYHSRVREALKQKFGYDNVMQIPKLTKIVLNMGVGDGARDIKLLEAAEVDLTLISGQKPRRNKARLSVSAFKLREGMPVGCSVTLRGDRMWEFLHRLIFIALPRVRDFRGLSAKSFDGRGNYSFGVKEHIIFPEVDITNIAQVRGLDVTIATTASTDAEARGLLQELGFPFRQ
jgi:large subunit ribosomal protein L5